MDALILSFFTIFAAEMGDKTQLIAVCLASHFKKPVPILLGIFAATLLSQLASGLVGHWLQAALSGHILHILLAVSFAAASVWAFIPDNAPYDEACGTTRAHSIFFASFFAFLVAEIGDKTQLATASLAAQFTSLGMVVTGATAGMMLANFPAVLFGHFIEGKSWLKTARLLSGSMFLLFALYEVHLLFA